MVAGERTLGPNVFVEEVGHFWGIVRTRPYMRARFGLAQCLEALDRREEAIEHYREFVRLNAGDNQGVRHSVLAALLLAGRDESGYEPAAYAPGSREEAVICDTELGEAWRATPDATRSAPTPPAGNRGNVASADGAAPRGRAMTSPAWSPTPAQSQSRVEK